MASPAAAVVAAPPDAAFVPVVPPLEPPVQTAFAVPQPPQPPLLFSQLPAFESRVLPSLPRDELPVSAAYAGEEKGDDAEFDAGSSADEVVAPPQLFASAFSAEQEAAVRAVMKEHHPNIKLSRAALTLLLRFSDRLAHYLLHRARLGLNTPAATDLSPSECDHRCGIQFAFPAAVDTMELRRIARDEQLATVRKWIDSGANETARKHTGLVTPLSVAQRWLADFHRGVLLQDPTAVTLPSQMRTVAELLGLCAMVEYILSEILELAGSECRAQRDPTTILSASILIKVMQHDVELIALSTFLPIDAVIDVEAAAGQQRITSPLQLSCASKPNDTPLHCSLLEMPFLAPTKAQRRLNESSWFFHEASVKSVARDAVRGQLQEAAIVTRQLRVQPIRYLGATNEVLPEFTLARISPHVAFLRHRLPRCGAQVLFGVSDARDQPFEFCIRAYSGDENDADVYLVQFGRLTLCAHFTASAIGVAQSAESMAQPAAAAEDPAASAASSQPALSLHFTLANGPTCFYPRAVSPAYKPEVENKQAMAALKLQQEADLAPAVAAAAKLARFSLYGPTLFTHNHSLVARQRFTAAVIDEAFLAADLHPLPAVLSEIIAQFACVDQLPFVQSLAEQQMRDSGFPLRQNASQYAGQLDSPIESPAVDSSNELDKLFPVAEVVGEDPEA